MANKNNSINPGRWNINCTCAWRRVANSLSNSCLKNESTVTIWLNNSVGGKYLNYLCFNLFFSDYKTYFYIGMLFYQNMKESV